MRLGGTPNIENAEGKDSVAVVYLAIRGNEADEALSKFSGCYYEERSYGFLGLGPYCKSFGHCERKV